MIYLNGIVTGLLLYFMFRTELLPRFLPFEGLSSSTRIFVFCLLLFAATATIQWWMANLFGWTNGHTLYMRLRAGHGTAKGLDVFIIVVSCGAFLLAYSAGTLSPFLIGGVLAGIAGAVESILQEEEIGGELHLAQRLLRRQRSVQTVAADGPSSPDLPS